ncbi:hypothetical protein PYCC9005_005223 [Savitreella phatthalungensis]
MESALGRRGDQRPDLSLELVAPELVTDCGSGSTYVSAPPSTGAFDFVWHSVDLVLQERLMLMRAISRATNRQLKLDVHSVLVLGEEIPGLPWQIDEACDLAIADSLQQLSLHFPGKAPACVVDRNILIDIANGKAFPVKLVHRLVVTKDGTKTTELGPLILTGTIITDSGELHGQEVRVKAIHAGLLVWTADQAIITTRASTDNCIMSSGHPIPLMYAE